MTDRTAHARRPSSDAWYENFGRGAAGAGCTADWVRSTVSMAIPAPTPWRAVVPAGPDGHADPAPGLRVLRGPPGRASSPLRGWAKVALGLDRIGGGGGVFGGKALAQGGHETAR